MKHVAAAIPSELSPLERRILRAVREISYGTVEVIIHERKVTEIRQTRRIRDVQEVDLPTGQPEEKEIIQRNDDCVYRVARTENHRTHV
jgi:hypothetical protein